MIKLLTDKSGWQFAVIKSDSHGGRWCEEQSRLDYDRSVEDVLKHINEGDVVIDAGAFIGAYSIPIAKRVGEKGKVYSFEPNAESYACLLVNSRDLPQIKPMKFGLSFAAQTKRVLIDSNAGATRLENTIAGIKDYSEVVSMVFLDGIEFDRCDFIKCDIEGFEPLFIQGAINTIRKFRPKIFIEVNDVALARYGFTKDDVIKPLLEEGYHVEFLDQKHHLLMPEFNIFLFPN